MSDKHPFVEYLEGLREDRGALAALRRGLGPAPGTATEKFRYVVPWVPKGCSRQEEEAYYLVAGFFAYHPKAGGQGDMGNHMAQARDPQGDNTAIERRFTALLGAHPEDLHFYLRQTISYLRSKEVPVDWSQLLRDLRAWGHPERYVQRQWARSFWGARPPDQATAQEEA